MLTITDIFYWLALCILHLKKSSSFSKKVNDLFKQLEKFIFIWNYCLHDIKRIKYKNKCLVLSLAGIIYPAGQILRSNGPTGD